MYKRAALVMFSKKRQLSVMLSSEHGEKWALEELEKSKSDGPTWANREIVEFLARKGQGNVVATILKIAIEWSDVVEWDYIVRWNCSLLLGEKGYTPVRGLGGIQIRGCAPNVSIALNPGIAHLHGSHAHYRFEKLFRAPGSEQAASIKLLLFVKDKISLGTNPETDEWISAATPAIQPTVAGRRVSSPSD